MVIARHVLYFCPADSQSMSFDLVSPYPQFPVSTAAVDVSHRTRRGLIADP